jgi:hypothetical protein
MESATAEEQMLTILAAAELAKVSERQMRRFVASGLVPAWRPSPQIIRIPRSELLRVMRRETEAN